MRYPSVNDYVEAVSNFADRLRTIAPMEPIYTEEGELYYTVSNGRVTFLLRDGGLLKGLSCFTSATAEAREREYIKAGLRKGDFHDMELLVFSDYSMAGDYFPVVLSDYLEHGVLGKQKDDISADLDIIEERRAFEKDGKWGFMDDEGHIVIESKYDSVGEFSEGRAVVEAGGMAGLIDRYGNEIIPLEYDELSWDGGVLAYVDKGGFKGCIDRMGTEVVPCRYDWVGEFSGGLVLVVLDGKHGYADMKGKEVLPLIYDNACSFDEHGYAVVSLSSRKMTIDKTGNIIK